MPLRATSFALALALAAACGTKDRGGTAADSPAAVDEPMPADAPALGIAAVDPYRWTLTDAALIELAVDAAAGTIEVAPTPDGLALNAFPPGGTLHQLGFRRGDVVTAIDGAALTDPSLLEPIYRRARDAGAVEVTIRRGGQPPELLERTFYLMDALARDQLIPADTSGAADDATTALAAALATGVRQTRADRLDLRYDIDALVVKTLAETPGILESGFSRRGFVAGKASALAALGLTPFDTIQSLDAHAIRSATSLATALGDLGAARAFSLSIIRVKTPLVIRYQVVDDLVMDGQLAAAVARWQEAQPERAPRMPRRTTRDAGDPTGGIEALGPEHYEIDRAVLAELLTASSRSARFLPAMRDGRSVGIKVYAVRPSSALARAGISNGDTIHTIGGTQLASLDDLEPALAAAARRSTVTIELTRRGQPMTLTYDVR